jgi:hypothetical protein
LEEATAKYRADVKAGTVDNQDGFLDEEDMIKERLDVIRKRDRKEAKAKDARKLEKEEKRKAEIQRRKELAAQRRRGQRVFHRDAQIAPLDEENKEEGREEEDGWNDEKDETTKKMQKKNRKKNGKKNGNSREDGEEEEKEEGEGEEEEVEKIAEESKEANGDGIALEKDANIPGLAGALPVQTEESQDGDFESQRVQRVGEGGVCVSVEIGTEGDGRLDTAVTVTVTSGTDLSPIALSATPTATLDGDKALSATAPELVDQAIDADKDTDKDTDKDSAAAEAVANHGALGWSANTLLRQDPAVLAAEAAAAEAAAAAAAAANGSTTSPAPLISLKAKKEAERAAKKEAKRQQKKEEEARAAALAAEQEPPDPTVGMDIEAMLTNPATGQPAGRITMYIRREDLPPAEEDDEEIQNMIRAVNEESNATRKKKMKKELKKLKKDKARLVEEEKAKRKQEREQKIRQGIEVPPERDRPNTIFHIFSIVGDGLRRIRLEETLCGWEIHRYRAYKSEWHYKGMHKLGALDRYQIITTNVSDSHTYKFSIKAINRQGISPESIKSNPVLIEPPLPSGWFRFYDKPKNIFYYANMKTEQSSWTRPDLDPWFLDESVIFVFHQREIAALKEIWEEEVLHFNRLSLPRCHTIFLEVGEKLSNRKLHKMYRAYCENEDYVETWQEFMAIMAHVKKAKSEPVLPPVPTGCLYFFSRRSVAKFRVDESKKCGDWTQEYNEIAAREYYFNNKTKESRWDMPEEVRFYLPPALEDELLETFDFGHVESLRQKFSQVDVDGSGDIDEREMKVHPPPLCLCTCLYSCSLHLLLWCFVCALFCCDIQRTQLHSYHPGHHSIL